MYKDTAREIKPVQDDEEFNFQPVDPNPPEINPADDGQAETVVVFPDNNDSTTETEPTPQSEPEDSNNGLQGQHFADTDDLN